ncbi:CoA ester lyase [Pleionea sp. CnH1-48]|uniref:HpcH/HpaI aldolase/citrate lyase family protein n=1 Tax=Pleionea sp. CnH1-48 TaxID=2954494 RepID=UPI002097652A|nr:CoA ester lyase [Pleionea sp. CnH1-48]MCO7226766.1 CoA ester lyase [Pleionea sp. CnH1-48]
MTTYRPRRTMLYVPAHIEKHINKARGLSVDSVIFDQQESVPPHQKELARETLKKQLANPDFGYSEKIVRINPFDTPWGDDDLKAAVQMDIDAILFPRMESRAQLEEAIYKMDTAGGSHLKVMVNIESPLGVLRAEEIAGTSDRLEVLVMGTTDLANELKMTPTPDRSGLLSSLSLVMLAGRAHKKCVIDGPHFDLKNVEACEFACRQARDLGFDGKTVIHPVQLNYTNDAFTPKRGEINKAKRILEAMEQANKDDRSIAILDDRLVEPSLAEWAERVISVYETVHQIGQSDLCGPEK